ncbi:MAG: hypothetical protein ACREXK_01160 [Gammaproteobacteria bacterium]
MDSPEAGSGKSLLVDAAAILASGGPASVMDFGRDAVEAGKRLDAMMLAGDPLIAVDNVEAPLEGAVLCQMPTQPARRIRVLGTHQVATVSCVQLVVATGCNLTLRGAHGALVQQRHDGRIRAPDAAGGRRGGRSARRPGFRRER